MPSMRVAIIDVGSNSVRLLVAAVEQGGAMREVERDRVYLRLGDDAYHLGRIRARKLDELELVAERFAQRARMIGVERLETIVTAPGRQASNADEVVDVLVDATRASVVVLSAETTRMARNISNAVDWSAGPSKFESHASSRARHSIPSPVR